MALIILNIVLFVVFLAFVWAIWARKWMAAQPWAKGFFAVFEPWEITLWRKSQTILKARTLMVLGGILTFMTQLGTLDISPLMPLVPDEYEPAVRIAFNMLPLLVSVLGFIDEWMRRDTTKPLELVAVAEESAPANVKAILDEAEAAKLQAVAEIMACKVSGEIQA
jgi:hypothetical protein